MIGIPYKNGKLADPHGQKWKLLDVGRMSATFMSDRKGSSPLCSEERACPTLRGTARS